MNSKMMIKRLILTIVGLCFLGAGVAMITSVNMGTEPMAGFVEIFSLRSGLLTYGKMTTVIEILMVIFAYFVSKKTVGIGTLITMLLVHLPIDLVYNNIPRFDSLFINICLIILGIILISLGAETIIHAGLGMGPYEAFMHSIANKSKISFTYVKYICDAIFLILTIIFKGQIGIGTILTYILTPLCMRYFEHTIKKIIKFE